MDIKKIVTTASVLFSLSSFATSDGYSKKDIEGLNKAFFGHKGRSIASLEKANSSAISTESNESGTLTINARLLNFNEANEKKERAAMILLEKVVNSDEFRDAVLNFTYKGKNEYIDNQGMSNQQIYDLFMSGKERLSPEADQEMDYDLALYRQSFGRCSVVGYGVATSPVIYVNRCKFNNFKLNEIAGNLFHEWLHKVGFGHSYKPNADRPYSVPYAIGRLVNTLGEKYQSEFFTAN